jgi:hypothetical protein
MGWLNYCWWELESIALAVTLSRFLRMPCRLFRTFGFARPCYGTEGRNRTDTPVKEPDFESGASTSSATPAR